MKSRKPIPLLKKRKRKQNENTNQELLFARPIWDLMFSLLAGEINEIFHFQKVFYHILSGDTIVLIDGFSIGLSIGSRGWADRGVQEPSSQTVVRKLEVTGTIKFFDGACHLIPL